MRPNEVTALFLVATVIAVAVYDVIAGIFYGDEATITHVVQEWGKKYVLLTIIIGIVLGHLFWPARGPKSAVPEPKQQPAPPSDLSKPLQPPLP